MSSSKEGGGSSSGMGLAVTSDYKGGVVFNAESAGYQNAVGMYTYAADGTITDVKIIWANASLKGSGGDLAANKSSSDFDLQSGDRVGFFVVPNGYGQSGMQDLLSDTAGHFKFVDAKGNPGSINGGVELKLVHVDAKGGEVNVKSEYGTSIFHSTDDGSKGLNGDKLNHVKMTFDTDKGTIKLGFEDLKGGGDKDYDDSVITIKLGTDNVKAIASGEAEKILVAKAAAEKAEADKVAAEKAAAEKAEADKVAAEKAAAEEAKHAAGELLVDGSFEQADVKANTWSHFKTVGGWTSDTEVEVWGKDFLGIKATDGDKHAELDFDGKQSNIYQDVATDAGKAYTFTFDYAARGGTSASTNTIEVFWNGEQVGVVDPTSTTWASASFQVVGTGGNDRIEFRESAGDNDSHGGMIDNASLKATPVVAPVDELALKTVDVVQIGTGEVLTGSGVNDGIAGGAGNDELYGKGGDDKLVGDQAALVKVPLEINVSLVDVDGSEAVNVTISGIPDGAYLSAGAQNKDGSWTLSLADLNGLVLVGPDSANFALHVTATATDSVTGAVMTQTGDINITLTDGNQDLLVGGMGDDNLVGGQGDDTLYGGSIPTGAPHTVTLADNDVVHGNDGNDRVYGNSGDDQVFGDAGDDFVSGGRGNDLVSGGDGNDTMQGNSGDDVMMADAGEDSITGGSGFDTLDFSDADQGIVVDMSAKTATGMGDDTVSGIERVIGSSFADMLSGDAKDNVFEAGDGDDTIRGGKGNDVLTGGAGNDTFVWAKSDVFNVKAQTGWVDHVTDFEVGDTLDLSLFVTLGAKGIDSLLQVTDGADGTTLSVKIGGQFHDVVVLDGVHGLTSSDMLKEGMLLVG